MLMIKNDSCEGKTLNLGNQSPEVSVRSVVEICHSVTGKNLRIKAISDLLNSPTRRSPDMVKTSSLINFIPSVSLQNGVLQTYNWYKLNVFLLDEISAK
jgi:nucleoside-diphosphate-sugar epimerase